ncbi:MAG: sulfotransferase [Deltaproteobacteria bacterium]|nr:sulfotransferase [Deltaproteobacteria bacterium]
MSPHPRGHVPGSDAIVPERSPIFVIGTGRSGTTLLRMMLCAHPRIYLTHEASFYVWESVFPWKRGAEAFLRWYAHSFSFRWLRVAAEPVLQGLSRPLTREHISDLYTAVMRAKAAEHGKVRFGDKTPSHAGNLPRLFADYPDARVIRIVRDPRGMLRSLSRMPWGTRSIVAGSMLCGTERRQVAPFRDRILEIRLEDLLEAPRETMEQVLGHVGEPWSDQVLDHAAHLPVGDDLPPVPWFQSAATKLGPPVKRWHDYDAREIRLLEYLNRKTMERFGFPPSELAREPGRLSVFLRWVTDLPEVVRFLYYFARVAWGSRNLERFGDLPARAPFRKLNPSAWALYPGFEMPLPPPLLPGWKEAFEADAQHPG